MTDIKTPGERIAELVTEALAAEEVVTPDAAAWIVGKMESEDPAGLDAFLRSKAVQIIGLIINRQMSAQRGYGRANARARGFGAAVADQDEDAVSLFATWHLVSPELTRKRLQDMTGAEHLFVADTYTQSGEADLMLAAFHRAVGKKVGNKRTADVISEVQCERIYNSITKTAAGRAA